MIAHDVIVQADIQPFGTPFTENEHNLYILVG